MPTSILCRRMTLVAVFSCFLALSHQRSFAAETDVVIYGGTPSGVMAAVAAARRGCSVALVEESRHVGGVVSGGLVYSDIGNRATVGGLADEFFQRVVRYYRDKYGADSKQFAQCRDGIKFEPHVAELIFDQFLAEQPKITLHKRQRIRDLKWVGDGKKLERLAALEADDLDDSTQQTFAGKIFIDATYTGDLMAAARVPYRVGRESEREYGEWHAGIRRGPLGVLGSGDHRTQSYNYRVSLTYRPENRVLFPKPEHYDPEPWKSTYGVRIKSRGTERFFDLFTSQDEIQKAQPNDKLDANWCDLIGGCEGYADGDWETRARIESKQRDYFLSLLYYLQNDPELPEKFHADAQNWGLPKDEFQDNGHFPHQVYVREARRLLGRYVLKEQDLTQDRYKPDGVCAGSYGIDCHTVQSILADGIMQHEANAGPGVKPYDIPYACMTPHEPANLLVPVCLSTSHVAYCSLRMEPVFMMLGHAAGDAAYLAVSTPSSVQAVDVQKLRSQLAAEKAALDAGYQPPVRIAWTPEFPQLGETVKFRIESGSLKSPLKQVAWDFTGTGAVTAESPTAEHQFTLEKVHSVSLAVEDQAGRRRLVTADVPVGRAIGRDVTLDDTQAELSGLWGRAVPLVFTGAGALTDVVRAGKKVTARARFRPTISRAERYEVCVGFLAAKNLATNVPITIRHAQGVTHAQLDERAIRGPFPFASLGEFRFRAGDGGFVEIANTGETDGRVALDAVRFVWLGD